MLAEPACNGRGGGVVTSMAFQGAMVSTMILIPANALSISCCTRSTSDFRNVCSCWTSDMSPSSPSIEVDVNRAMEDLIRSASDSTWAGGFGMLGRARSLPNRKNISRYQDGCEARGFSKGRRSPKRRAKPSDDRSGGSAARSPCGGPSRRCQSYADRLSAAGPPGPDDSAGAPHSGGEVRGAICQAQVRWRTFGPDGAPIRPFRDTFRDRRCFRDPQLAFQEPVALQALGEWRAACACAQRQSLPSH